MTNCAVLKDRHKTYAQEALHVKHNCGANMLGCKHSDSETSQQYKSDVEPKEKILRKISNILKSKSGLLTNEFVV